MTPVARTLGVFALGLFIAGCSFEHQGDDSVSKQFGSDYFGAGGSLNLTDPVAGDAMLAGGHVATAGEVKGDLVAAGGEVSIGGSVGDDLYVAGGDVQVDAIVAGNARVAGGDVALGPATTIAGGLSLTGGRIRFEGNAQEYLKASGASVRLDGVVRGDAEVHAEEVEIGPNTRIDGKLVVHSAREPALPEGAQIAGGIEFHQTDVGDYVDEHENARDVHTVAHGVGSFLWMLGVFVAGTLFMLAFPAYSTRAAQWIGQEPLRSLGLGIRDPRLPAGAGRPAAGHDHRHPARVDRAHALPVAAVPRLGHGRDVRRPEAARHHARRHRRDDGLEAVRAAARRAGVVARRPGARHRWLGEICGIVARHRRARVAGLAAARRFAARRDLIPRPEESRTMMANYWPHLLAMLVGGALTVQVGMNATLARVIGSPLWASAVNFAIGLLALVGFAVVAGSRASTGSFGQVPAWAWMGGLLGAVYVASVTILGPRLGGMTLVALVIAGQLIVALVVDQFGILGYPQIAVTPTRLLGAALLLVGALLVMRR